MKIIYDSLRRPAIQHLREHAAAHLKKDLAKANHVTLADLSHKTKSARVEDTIKQSANKSAASTTSACPYQPSLMQSIMAGHSQSINTALKIAGLSTTSDRVSSQYSTTLSYRPSPIQIAMQAALKRSGVRQFSTMVDKMEKFGDPKNDVVFKKLFGNEQNKDLLIDFINSMLPGKDIQEIEYIPTNLEPDIRAKKQSILDVLCTDRNGSKYIIEMQNAKEKGFEKRAVYYASKTYATQMNKGGKYADLREVIFIAITDFIMFPGKKAYISTHTIRDIETNEHDLKDFTFAFMELPKYQPHKGAKHIDEWCELFKFAKDRKTVETTNPIIKKAYETLEMSNWTQQELLDYQAFEKIMLDNQAREDQVRDEGRAEGRAEGIEEGKADTARRLKELRVATDVISQATGLTKDDIDKL